jgi:hypothetical protein
MDKPTSPAGPVIDTARPRVPNEPIGTGHDVGRRTENSQYVPGSTQDPRFVPDRTTTTEKGR